MHFCRGHWQSVLLDRYGSEPARNGDQGRRPAERTKVEGVYSADPVLVKDAVKYDEITYMEILRQGLKVMDLTAVSLCKDNNLPMIIFNMNRTGQYSASSTRREGRFSGNR